MQDEDANALKFTKGTRADFLSIAIEFFGTIARSLLNQVKEKRSGADVNHRLLSAQLNVGMWFRYPNEEVALNYCDRNSEDRFQLYYFTNFKALLDWDLLRDSYPRMWSSDKLSHEKEYI